MRTPARSPTIFATSRIPDILRHGDLKDMALNMKPYAPKETENLLAAMEKAVVYKVHTLRPRHTWHHLFPPTVL